MEEIQNNTDSDYHDSFEILTFDLNSKEIFGLNVFKVHEVLKRPDITRIPNAPLGLKGNISLRGEIIPVVGLSELMGLGSSDDDSQGILIVSEINEKMIGLLVNRVDKIVRVNWNAIEDVGNILDQSAHDIVGIVNIEEKLVSIIDIENVLCKVFSFDSGAVIKGVVTKNINVLFVDDSLVARKKINEVLEKMGINAYSANNGVEAFEKLKSLTNIGTKIDLVLSDIEMPKMNGYELVSKIKASNLLKDIPILMFSSLSTNVNRQQAEKMGIQDYVVKFHMEELSEKILKVVN